MSSMRPRIRDTTGSSSSSSSQLVLLVRYLAVTSSPFSKTVALFRSGDALAMTWAISSASTRPRIRVIWGPGGSLRSSTLRVRPLSGSCRSATCLPLRMAASPALLHISRYLFVVSSSESVSSSSEGGSPASCRRRTSSAFARSCWCTAWSASSVNQRLSWHRTPRVTASTPWMFSGPAVKATSCPAFGVTRVRCALPHSGV
mmetsp:Transcript_76273/g.231256  ORF Transcript_76273/g.231256 Transcript_76273/m.231256 type:complete len:202 (+) Transcript_76273:624-1229(+)